MSLISLSSSVLFVFIRLMNSSFSSLSNSISEPSNWEKPTIALSGVRISWLILARNADFILSDSSAFFRAFIRSNSVSLICWILRQRPFTSTEYSSVGDDFIFLFCAYLNSHHSCPFLLKSYLLLVICREVKP